MKCKRLFFVYLSALLILTAGCNATNEKNVTSFGASSAAKNLSSESVSSSGSPSTSSNPSKSPVTTNSSSNSTTTSSASEAKGLLFAEDDHTKAIFHIGMTREQVKQALKDNQLRMKPNDYGYSDEEVLNELGFGIIGGVEISFDSKTGLLNQLIIFPASDTELSSPYETQKGLKIGDTVETVIKLYGEPLKKIKCGDVVNEDLRIAYCYDLPINLNHYYKESKEIIGSGNDSSDSTKKSAQLVISVSQMKGDKFNRVEAIVY